MPTLLEKIEANAAVRLKVSPGKTAADELARFKAFLKVETHRLKLLHRSGAGGREVCQARAAIIDVLLRYLWEAAKNTLSLQGRKEFPPLALVALGGYGRAELNPHSDIDFMFLHAGQVVAGSKPLPHLSKIIDGILYPLWDMGLKVGHSVRDIADCVNVARTDMQSKTSLIEARLIVGDAALFKRFQGALVDKCVSGYEKEYIAARLEDQAARRAKHGNSACMQEPNIKNGCGGLRDFQNLLWMAFFKYRTRSLLELQERELITQQERKQLEAAYDYLLRVRNELHYHVNRAVDVITKNLQPAIAHNLGHTDRSPSRRLEQFMREFYTFSRNLYIITRTLEQRMALLPQAAPRFSLRSLLRDQSKPSAEPAVDGFKFVNGQILHASARVFRDQPRRLMRVFLHAQQRGLGLHPDLAQLIRNQLDLVDRDFLHDEHARETFLSILGRRGNVAPALRAMHEVGLLGRYLPEFGKLTCLVQHEFYHQYTADEHTLVCLEQLDRVWEARETPHRSYAQLLQGVERPFILYLALLLHDVGKAEAHGKHSEASSQLALRAARRLGLDSSATNVLRLVIEHHLLMASISQRRDLGDPAVIRTFARRVQTPETLALLTLHTFVDTLATSDRLWNGFKDSLLWSLYSKTLPLLTGSAEFIRAEEKQRELLMSEVRRQMPRPQGEDELNAHFTGLPARYFQIHAAGEIVDDLALVHRFLRLQIADDDSVLAPVIHWHNDPDRGGNTVKICTWDRAGLFSKISGSFSAAGLNILSAQIFTRADGIVLDTFFVTDARTGATAEREARDQFAALLGRFLAGREAELAPLSKRPKPAGPLYQSYAGERMATVIAFDNETSETRTVIDIETEDRLGLLYAVSQALSELGLDISAAKIFTEKGAAIDSFYVSELDGQKILDADRQRLVDRELRQAVNCLDQG